MGVLHADGIEVSCSLEFAPLVCQRGVCLLSLSLSHDPSQCPHIHAFTRAMCKTHRMRLCVWPTSRAIPILPSAAVPRSALTKAGY